MQDEFWDTYWFEKNLQGDIVAVFTASGIRFVTYTYDAWGKSTVGTNKITVEDVENNIKTYSKINGGCHLTSITERKKAGARKSAPALKYKLQEKIKVKTFVFSFFI